MYTDPTAASKIPGPDDAPARKFMFERSFNDADVVHRAPERKPVMMKPEQVDALRKEGFDAGVEAGKQAAIDAQADALAKLLATIDQNVAALLPQLAALARQQDANTRQLALAVAKKILPDFTAREGLAEIDALLENTIREMAREPRLVVRVHEAQFDQINERVQQIATQRAYPGKVIVLADAEVMPGDCRVEWADGGVERNGQAVWQSVAETLSPSA